MKMMPADSFDNPSGYDAAADLRPPVVQAAKVAHDRAAHHDVVEVRDDEIGVGDVHVQSDRREKQPREPADREQSDEADRVEHRRLPRHRSLVHRGRPVEDLHGRREWRQES